MIKCEDLFIVTSCTNTADISEAVNHNASHSQWQRGEELLSTLSSIRVHYPEAIIVNLENSRVEEDLAIRIRSRCDERRDYSSDKCVRKSRTFGNKGIPWLIKVMKFLHEEGNNLYACRIHLLCGRYLLTSKLCADLQDNYAYFRYYPQHDNVSTRYFFYHRVPIMEIRASLMETLRPLIFSWSVEDFIHRKGQFSKGLLEHIGVAGMVNGKQFIEE